MAQRKALARMLAGLGEGITNASGFYLAQDSRNKAQDRMDDRADAAAKASFARTEFAANRQAAREIQNKIATGELDPQQGAVMLSNLLGEDVGTETLEPVRPPLMKRLGKQFKDSLGASFPEGLPTEEEILNFTKADGGMVPGALDMPMSADTPSGVDPFSMLRTEAGADAKNFLASVGARRRSLQSRPTERVTRTNPTTGAEEVITTSPYDLQRGMTTGLTPTQKGANAATERTTFLGAAGPAEAGQKALEAGAVEDAQNTPGRQAARTSEAVNREVQTFKALLPYKLDLAAKTAAGEIQQAVNKENATNVAAAVKASGMLLGPQFFDRVVDLTAQMNTQEGSSARLQGAGTTIAYYMGGAPELKELEQLVAQNTRSLAQVFGVKEGNPSDKDMANVKAAVGIDQFATRTERVNALRNLQDMISIGPVVASRMPASAGISERLEFAKKLASSRRAAETAAIDAGATEYNDPVTHARIKVIQY